MGAAIPTAAVRDIEMHYEMSMRQSRQRTSASGDRVGDHLRASQPGRWHQTVHVLLVVAKADEGNVRGLQQRPSRADAGELRYAAGQVEHVGDTHRIEDRFVWMVDGDHQVLATVDIDQSDFAVSLDHRCHQRERWYGHVEPMRPEVEDQLLVRVQEVSGERHGTAA